MSSNNYIKFINHILKEEKNFFLKFLLFNFKELNLTSNECFLVSIIYFLIIEKTSSITLESNLSRILNKEEGDILFLISNLIEKNIILYEEKESGVAYSLSPLIEKVFIIWEERNIKRLDNIELNQKENILHKSKNDLNIKSKLYCLFEGEFRRLLSPMEIDFLTEWMYTKKFSDKMIIEALKEAVSQGKLSFKYIDRILLDWGKKGVFNSKENELLKKKKKNNIKKVSNKYKKNKNNYDDLYFN